ncbi:MAG: sulfatase-like hydrolase/transferase [Alphaproteobacteria bacterium]
MLATALLGLPVYAADRIYYNPFTALPELGATALAVAGLLALTGSVLATFIVIHLVLAANYMKFFFLREGLVPTDLELLGETWQAAGSGVRMAVVLVTAIGLAVTFLFANRDRWRSRATIVAAIAGGLWIALMQPAAVKAALFPGDYERYWQPGSEFQARGFFTSFAMVALNTKVLKADLSRLPFLAHPPSYDLRGRPLPLPEKPADVHIVLLESFIAPEDLTALSYRRLPGSPTTRDVARESSSYAFSPTAGGKTARAEFEVLCGIPDFELFGSLTFNQLGGGKVDCLPARLSAHGYRSVASQALPASFFNIGRAYRSLGFDEQLLASDFIFDDMDGAWLSNPSALGQNLDLVRDHATRHGDRPLLNYVVLGAGHYPFDRDRNRRPDLVASQPADHLADRIVNHSLHTLDALAEWLAALRAMDRPSIIILFADHLPPVSDDFLERTGYRGFDRAKPITGRRTFLLVLRDFEPAP